LATVVAAKEENVRFVHRFNSRLSVELMVCDQPPVAGENHIQEIRWSARPKARHLPEYLAWIHTVNEHLSSLWGISIVHCVEVSSQNWQCFGYEPGQPVKKIND
jgi:hypothetical protein